MSEIVNRTIQEIVELDYGAEVWEKVAHRTGLDVCPEAGEPDATFAMLIDATSEELRLPARELLEQFGAHWIVNTAQNGYGDTLMAGGATLRDFLINLPVFHARLSMIFPRLEPLAFDCGNIGDRSVRMHYRCTLPGLAPFVRGMFLGLGELYDTAMTVDQVADKSAGADHDEFDIRW